MMLAVWCHTVCIYYALYKPVPASSDIDETVTLFYRYILCIREQPRTVSNLLFIIYVQLLPRCCRYGYLLDLWWSHAEGGC